jgi:hypothetical protein
MGVMVYFKPAENINNQAEEMYNIGCRENK